MTKHSDSRPPSSRAAATVGAPAGPNGDDPVAAARSSLQRFLFPARAREERFDLKRRFGKRAWREWLGRPSWRDRLLAWLER